jgi:hypothetical protein
VVLGAGRGDAFRNVVEAYCRFFDALGRRKRAGRLKKLLRAAEESLAELQKEVETNETSREDEPAAHDESTAKP